MLAKLVRCDNYLQSENITHSLTQSGGYLKELAKLGGYDAIAWGYTVGALRSPHNNLPSPFHVSCVNFVEMFELFLVALILCYY